MSYVKSDKVELKIGNDAMWVMEFKLEFGIRPN
jgi:hypothetical protein